MMTMAEPLGEKMRLITIVNTAICLTIFSHYSLLFADGPEAHNPIADKISGEVTHDLKVANDTGESALAALAGKTYRIPGSGIIAVEPVPAGAFTVDHHEENDSWSVTIKDPNQLISRLKSGLRVPLYVYINIKTRGGSLVGFELSASSDCINYLAFYQVGGSEPLHLDELHDEFDVTYEIDETKVKRIAEKKDFLIVQRIDEGATAVKIVLRDKHTGVLQTSASQEIRECGRPEKRTWYGIEIAGGFDNELWASRATETSGISVAVSIGVDYVVSAQKAKSNGTLIGGRIGVGKTTDHMFAEVEIPVGIFSAANNTSLMLGANIRAGVLLTDNVDLFIDAGTRASSSESGFRPIAAAGIGFHTGRPRTRPQLRDISVSNTTDTPVPVSRASSDSSPHNSNEKHSIPIERSTEAPTESIIQTPAESDSDNDGVPDSQDRCPNIPENRNDVDDDDGCPEFEVTVKHGTELYHHPGDDKMWRTLGEDYSSIKVRVVNEHWLEIQSWTQRAYIRRDNCCEPEGAISW